MLTPTPPDQYIFNFKINKEDKGFEPLRAFTHLTVFKTVPFSRTWVILLKEIHFMFIKSHDPYGIRTRVTAVKGQCLNRLTNGPTYKKLKSKSAKTEKEGFEPLRRVQRPTPLAGAPLQPLEYFPKTKKY